MTLIFFTAILTAIPVVAQSPSAAVTTDPPIDVTHKARMEVVHIPTHGLNINGVFYLAAGAGPHATLVFFHGLPGNEQNLDLAQAIRRAGWNVLTLHYRGSWGSPGMYSYRHLLEDGTAATAFVRNPANARAYNIDIDRVVLAGHSTAASLPLSQPPKPLDCAD